MTMPLNDAGSDLHRWHRDHDRGALERLLTGSLDRAYTQARRTLGNDADAQDAVQEALIQVMRSAHTYDPSRPFAPWLARLVHVACCRLRWRARRARARERAAAQPDATVCAEEVDVEAVRAAVAELPERDRAAVELHYWAGLPQAEVARELGVSENALGVRLHRARERLRDLLARRGLAMGSAALVAALAPAQAWAAPPALVAGAQALGSAATLPATAIPLGAAREAAWTALHHPWWSAGVAAVLAGGIGLGVALLPGHPPQPPQPPRAEVPPVPPVATPAAGPWQGPAREALRWLDPKAPVRMGFDLATMRAPALAAKPWSLLADPQSRPALQRLRAKLTTGSNALTGLLVCVLWESGDGWVASGADSQPLIAMALPAVLPQELTARLSALPAAPAAAGDPGWILESLSVRVPDAGGMMHDLPAAALGLPSEPMWVGRHGRILAIGTPTAVPARAAALPAEVTPDLPGAAWVRTDLGPLIAAYAAADPGNLTEVGDFLGPRWRTLAPLCEVAAGIENGVAVSEARVSRAIAISPLNLGPILAKGGDSKRALAWPLPQASASALRRADPARIAAAPAAAMLSASVGIDATELRAMLGAMPALQVPGLDRLLPACSGDFSLCAEAGSPLPAISLVCGLDSRPDPGLITALLARFGWTATDPPAGCRAAWQAFTAAGAVQVLLAEGRLVVSTASDPTRFLKPAGASPEAPLVMDADLPGLVSTYGPYLLGIMRIPVGGTSDVIDGSCLPPVPVLARHLAPWHMAWTPTPDGCVIHERGMPLLAAWTAVTAISLVSTCDPVAEARRGQDQRMLGQLSMMHPEELVAVAAAADALVDGGPCTDAQRHALSMLFGGRLPTDAEIAGLGTRYEVGEPVSQITVDVRFGGPPLKLPDGRYVAGVATRIGTTTETSYGLLRWAMPLHDGWSLGLVRNTAGFFKGDPPPTNRHPTF